MTELLLWQPFAGWLGGWFRNPKYTAMAQVITAFVWGLLFSPWASGIFVLTIFIIIYELLAYIFTKGDPVYFDPFTRAAVVCSYVLGYIVGRTLSEDEILKKGIINISGDKYID